MRPIVEELCFGMGLRVCTYIYTSCRGTVHSHGTSALETWNVCCLVPHKAFLFGCIVVQNFFAFCNARGPEEPC